VKRLVTVWGKELTDFTACTFDVHNLSHMHPIITRATNLSLRMSTESLLAVKTQRGIRSQATTLTLTIVSTEGVGEENLHKGIQKLLTYFPALVALNVHGAEGPQVLETILKVTPELETLTILESSLAPLSTCNRVPSVKLKTLRLTDSRHYPHNVNLENEHRGLARLIEACKESLTHLHIDNHSGMTRRQDEGVYYSILPAGNRISSLTTCCWDSFSNIVEASGVHSVQPLSTLHLLESHIPTRAFSIPFRSLTEIMIDGIPRGCYMDSAELSAIVGYLAVHRSSFPNVRRIRINMTSCLVAPCQIIEACMLLTPTQLRLTTTS
jgi:hypothetical protein